MPQCWESKLGAELYRLTMLDFIVQLLVSVSIMATNKLFSRCGSVVWLCKLRQCLIIITINWI